MSTHRNSERRVYEKPKLVVIDLKAEEVLGGACKTEFTPLAQGGGFGCATSTCSNDGS